MYFVWALYEGSRIRSGDLGVRFGYAILLFFVIPAPFYLAQRRAERRLAQS